VRGPSSLILFLSYAAFVSLGLPDTVLGVAWPSVSARFGLSPGDIGALLACTVTGNVVSGLVAGRLMAGAGVAALLAGSSGLVALGLLGYTLAPRWSLFFPMAVIVGLGSGAIDAGLNTFAAGHFPVRHVNWLHAFWGVGASLGPAIMTAAVAGRAGYGAGYVALSAALAAMGAAFVLTRRWWDDGTAPAGAAAPAPEREGAIETLRRPTTWIQVGLFFLYTGAEASVGIWCFTLLRERGLPVEGAGLWTSVYWGSLTAGRFLLGTIIDRVGPDLLLRAGTMGAVIGTGMFAVSAGPAGRLGLVLTGLSLAPMFPTLMARTPARLGAAAAAHAVGFQVSAATLGAAVLPAAIGFVIARAGVTAIGPMVAAMAVALLLAYEALLAATGSELGLRWPGRGARSQGTARVP
jgi:fucose permease